jgi:hypothetical protein
MDAVLQQYAAQGLSASQIGTLVNRSRHSVIGRANRLNIQLKGIDGNHSKGSRKKPEPQPVNLDPVPAPPDAVLLEQLGPDMCHWPYGLEAPYRFCGHPISYRCYCLSHALRSFHPEYRRYVN